MLKLPLQIFSTAVLSSVMLPITALANEAEGEPHWLLTLIVNFVPMLVLIGIWIVFMRRYGTGVRKDYIERTRLHMERLEEDSRKQVALLQEVVTLLKNRG